MQEVVVNIDKSTAEIKVEGRGFSGDACSVPVSQLARALGATDAAREELKPEYYMARSRTQDHLREGGIS